MMILFGQYLYAKSAYYFWHFLLLNEIVDLYPRNSAIRADQVRIAS
jgi:hypothetical protein